MIISVLKLLHITSFNIFTIFKSFAVKCRHAVECVDWLLIDLNSNTEMHRMSHDVFVIISVVVRKL